MASTLSLAQTASRKHAFPRIAVSLLGTGQVGGALLRQLAEQDGFAVPRLVGVANSRRALAAPEGIAPADALSRLWDEGGKPGLEAPLAAVTNIAADVRVIVDATAAQEVAAHHRRWLARGSLGPRRRPQAADRRSRRWKAARGGRRAGPEVTAQALLVDVLEIW